MINVNAVEKFI